MEDDFSRWFLSWFPYIKRGDVPLFPGDSQGPTAGMTSGVPPWGSDITARDGHPIVDYWNIMEYPYQLDVHQLYHDYWNIPINIYQLLESYGYSSHIHLWNPNFDSANTAQKWSFSRSEYFVNDIPRL